MIGTFMLEALRGAFDVRDALARLKLDWPRAMVLVSSRAGSNVSSGLTEGTNWLPLFLKAASGFTLPDDRIKIVPLPRCGPRSGRRNSRRRISLIMCSACGARCSRKLVSDQVFASIPTIYLPDRPPLPGDYDVTKAGAIDQFMIRMKHSLRDARDALQHGGVLDGAGAREEELGCRRGRHSRPHHRPSRPASRLSRGDVEVGACCCCGKPRLLPN